MNSSEPAKSRKRLYRGKLGRVNFEPTNPTFRTLVPAIHRLLRLATKKPDWRGGENLPANGPAIVVANHISSLDPVLLGEFLAYSGRWPHYLARANLFDMKLLGRLLRAAEQIPVYRGSLHAGDALIAAEAALLDGQLVVIYPEGTITFDPDEWPMAPHTGAARLALRTGAPVIPVGQWGANLAVPPRNIRPMRLRRSPVTMVCGPKIDLSEYDADPDRRRAVRDATVHIMDAITTQAELARGAKAPADRWLPRREQRVPRPEAIS